MILKCNCQLDWREIEVLDIIKSLIIICTLPSFRQCVEPESSDVAFPHLGVFAGAKKSLDAGLRISGMTDKGHSL